MYLSQNLLLQYWNVLVDEWVKQMRGLNKKKEKKKKKTHFLIYYFIIQLDILMNLFKYIATIALNYEESGNIGKEYQKLSLLQINSTGKK